MFGFADCNDVRSKRIDAFKGLHLRRLLNHKSAEVLWMVIHTDRCADQKRNQRSRLDQHHKRRRYSVSEHKFGSRSLVRNGVSRGGCGDSPAWTRIQLCQDMHG